ncbi:MAG: hypothetical protein HUU35_10020, partial [Armatimonadetes bacterium]|nr:hypothetical protein [Armatimonadota bacterium]
MQPAALRALLAACCLLATVPATSEVVVDRLGQVSAVDIGGEYRRLATQLAIPMKGWGRFARQSEARDLKTTRDGDRSTWSGRLVLPGEVSVRFTQTLTATTEGLQLDYQLVPEGTADVEGVYWWLDLPIADYSGAPAALLAGEQQVAGAEMPREQPPHRHILSGTAERAVLGPS